MMELEFWKIILGIVTTILLLIVKEYNATKFLDSKFEI